MGFLGGMKENLLLNYKIEARLGNITSNQNEIVFILVCIKRIPTSPSLNLIKINMLFLQKIEVEG